MRILVLNGSPKAKNSNTIKLTHAFVAGILEKKQAEVDIIDVSKMNVKDCIGCFCCWNKSPGKCCISDDMANIIEKLRLSDIIIWSFPLYYFSVPSKLKAVIDRQLPMSLPFMSRELVGGHLSRYNMTGKQYVVISTCGFYTADGNYNAVNEQFDRIYGKNAYTAIYCGQGELFRVQELRVRTDEYLEYVRQAGDEFAIGGISSQTAENLSELLYTREIFEEMADASWGVSADEQSPIDQSLIFTRQMAALYNKSSYNDKDKVVEFHYTDVNKTYQIILNKDGYKVLTENFLPYTTRIETPFEIWQKISKGEISGEQALMEHLYAVKGDFELMIRWDEHFGLNSSKVTSKIGKSVKKTNMSLLLLPWIVIWIALAISPTIGGVMGILVSTALPLAYVKYRTTVFEYITCFFVSVISLLSLLWVEITVILPLSYLLFGIMWTVTAFMKIPLTAYYSMNDYSGEKAFKNPLFIKTNRILTASWGVLYLLTPIWTYLLITSPVGSFTGAINSVLPTLMVFFTAWFQKWYPKHYASRK